MRVTVSRLGSVLTVLAACGGDGTKPSPTAQHDASIDPALAADGGADEGATLVAHDAGHEPAHVDAGRDEGRDDASAPACVRDSDCDDGDACTGSERCVDDVCVAGEPPCSNPDPAHCTVSCTADGATATCSVAGRDLDADGHGDQACAAAAPAADDCDDGQAAVYRGASELCDGLDNDCNGRADLDDGLTLAGENKLFGTGGSATVAAWGGESFGLAYVHDDSVWLRELDLHGEPLHEEVLVSGPTATNGSMFGGPALEFGGSSYGVSWARGRELGFRRVAKDGQALGDVVQVGPADFAMFGRTRLASVGKEWVLAFECCQSRPSVHARRILGDDTVMPPLYNVSNVQSSALSGLAVSGEQVGMLWWRYWDPDRSYFVEWTRRDLDLTPRPDEQPLLTHPAAPGFANQGVMSATDDGWAIAYHESHASDATLHLQFMRFDRSGQLVCGPTDLDAAYPTGATHVVAEDMVTTERGFALSGRSSADGVQTVELLQVNADCTLERRLPLGTTSAYPSSQIARAEGGELLVSWMEGYSQAPIKLRALPALLCE